GRRWPGARGRRRPLAAGPPPVRASPARPGPGCSPRRDRRRLRGPGPAAASAAALARPGSARAPPAATRERPASGAPPGAARALEATAVPRLGSLRAPGPGPRPAARPRPPPGPLGAGRAEGRPGRRAPRWPWRLPGPGARRARERPDGTGAPSALPTGAEQHAPLGGRGGDIAEGLQQGDGLGVLLGVDEVGDPISGHEDPARPGPRQLGRTQGGTELVESG